MKLLNDIWKIITTSELREYLLEGFIHTLIISNDFNLSKLF